jgi:flavin reductase (DIM6/NTAB) family NADH-FMN oxidoreductase RutF
MKTEWLHAFGTMTYGIYVLTTALESRINGMIASWVSQVSYEPPLIGVAVHRNRFTHQLVKDSGCFALHVLSKGQKSMVSQFMGSDPETKFSGTNWKPGLTGCPILPECTACFECEIITSFEPGNHTIFIGQVVNAATSLGAEPLTTLDYRGQYIGKM